MKSIQTILIISIVFSSSIFHAVQEHPAVKNLTISLQRAELRRDILIKLASILPDVLAQDLATITWQHKTLVNNGELQKLRTALLAIQGDEAPFRKIGILSCTGEPDTKNLANKILDTRSAISLNLKHKDPLVAKALEDLNLS